MDQSEDAVFLRNSKGVQTSRSITKYGVAFSDSLDEVDFQVLAGIKKIKFTNLLEKLRFYTDTGLESTDIFDSDQLLLCLMMYKTKFDINLVAKFFSLDKKVALSIFSFWTCLIYKYLKSIPFWRILEFSNCSRKLIVLQVNSVSVVQNRMAVFSKNSQTVSTSTSGKVGNQHKSFKYLVALSDRGHVIYCSETMNDSYTDSNVVRISKSKKSLKNQFLFLFINSEIIIFKHTNDNKVNSAN